MQEIRRLALSRGSTLLWAVLALLIEVLPSYAAGRPNVLVIYTDEHHFNTLGCYGGSTIETPNIDSIAASGARCTSFYAATPVCSPSRASLISGKYPQNTDVVGNNIPLNPNTRTFASLLKAQGYATGWCGKWHLAGDGKPQWAPPQSFGFEDNRFMFNRGHWKKLEDGPEGPKVGSRNRKGVPDYGLEGANEQNYATDWLVTKTIDFIRAHQDQPFCYVTSLPDPHGPNRVRAPYNTQFVGREVKLPPSLSKPDDAYPAWAPKNPRINPRWLRANLPQYYGMVKCIDDNIGRILKVLKELDQLDNTIIVFTSDHGDLCGEHGRSEKGNPYEGSARIPFLLSYPGVVPAGLRIDQALNTADFLPTLMSLMRVPVEHQIDGRDASELFRGGESRGWEDIAFLRSTHGNAWIAAVTDHLKLVLSVQEDPWLFDLADDAHELNNRINQPKYHTDVARLVSGLQAYGERVGDPYLNEARIREQLRALAAR